MSVKKVKIAGRSISSEDTPYIVAEISGNHQQSITHAKELIQAAAEAGADAVKMQTYTPDTLTLPSRKEYFKKSGSLWDGMYLYDLYTEGMTPWEWFPELNEYAKACGLTFFSTPFDESAVEFLEESINPPAYKIASYEINHIPLLEAVGSLGKPVVISTGMATEKEIATALKTLNNAGAKEIIVLKCISGYPAEPEDFHLNTIPELKKKFKHPVGLSDHSLGNEVCLGAVALGACFIEKHLIMSRKNKAIDDGFSLEPQEFESMVEAVNTLHRALGSKKIGPSQQEAVEVSQRRSIFIAQSVKKGTVLTDENLRIVRPAHGIAPSEWKKILGKRAARSLEAGEPLKQGDWAKK